jgi:hypothetical protein
VLDELGRERTVVAFLVAADTSEFAMSAASKGLYSDEFKLDFLSPDQAISFVRSRLTEFRKNVDNLPAWIAQEDWALFPFKREAIELAVELGVLGDAAEKRARPTLRNLNSILKKALEEEMKRLGRIGDDGVRAVTASEIPKRVIDVLRFVAALTSSIMGKPA